MAIKRKRTMRYQREKVAIEHTAFYPYFQRYTETMRVRNYSASTLQRRESNLRRFIAWCEERSIATPQAVTKPILESYQRHLFYYRQDNGEPLGVSTRNHYISDIKQFFKWLTQDNYLLYNPASELIVPRQSPSLPSVLTPEEIEALMNSVDTNTTNGIRDRAVLEVLYSTGIRRVELCNLKLQDVSLARLTLYVRHGKGGKDRLLPLGARAAQWVNRYLQDVRPQLVIDDHNHALFLNDYGDAFSDNKLGDKVKRHLKNSGINVPGACHLLRHAMATHMLENGADIRYIQAMLGHADLGTTQIYTHVSIRKLQEIHAATHPAKVEKKGSAEAEIGGPDYTGQHTPLAYNGPP